MAAKASLYSAEYNTMSLRKLPLLAFFLAVLSPLSASTTITLQQGVSPSGYTGTADAFVTSGTTNNADPAKNYGAAGALAVSASGLSQGEFQSLIQFDLASAKSQLDTAYPSGWTINSVALTLMPQTANNAIFNAAHSGNFVINWVSSDAWTEGTGTPAIPTTDGITYNALSSLLSGGTQSLGSFTYNGTTGTAQTYTFSAVSAGLTSDITSGSKATFDLAAAVGDTQLSAIFNSKTFGTSANRPALSITASAAAAPEPGRTSLLMAAFVGVVMQRRRHA